MKNICLLGATGSIGQSTLDIIKANPNEYCLTAFSFNQNLDKARQIIDEFHPTFVASPVIEHIETLKANKIMENFTGFNVEQLLKI